MKSISKSTSKQAPSDTSNPTEQRSDPFENVGRRDVPLPAREAPPSEALRDSDLPANFHKIVGQKRRSGLTRSQAEAVARAQVAHDLKLEAANEAAAKAAARAPEEA